MASIRHLASRRSYRLTSAYIVGRGSGCALQLSSRLVSVEHAAFHWTDEGWELRDLGSSNGTFVDGRRLAAGDPIRLEVGARIAFGDPDDPYELIDDRPPVAMVRSLDGERIEADGGLLLVPDPEQPALIIAEESSGLWFVETTAGERRRARDGETLQCAGRSWCLTLPRAHARTLPADQDLITIGDIGLRFAVSRDEEHVAITVLRGREAVTQLPHRSHSYMLLTLARARVEDGGDDVPEHDRGWVYVEEITRMLGVTDSQLNLLIHRARAQLRDIEILRAWDLVERRPSTRQLRLGTRHIELDGEPRRR